MALKIRLRQQGRKNHRTFRLVVADERSPRDGKYIESLGFYDPQLSNEKQAQVQADRILFWVDSGAQISENASTLINRVAPEVMVTLRNKKQKSN